MVVDAQRTGTLLGGRYRLGPLLGRGGMAEVYDGVDERLGRPVAVKLLQPSMAARPEVRNRFEGEARAAARLSHPNVVGVFDSGEEGVDAYLVMERLPGDTLADRMAAGPMPPDEVRRVAGDVLGALAAAHDAGIVHRDIKPGNILIGADGCAKVADFGIAMSAEASTDATATGLLLGTPAYLAPERIEGRPATARSDLYAVGVVLYEALSGRRPFAGATPLATAAAIQRGRATPLRELRPDLDASLLATVDRSMDPDPLARPASARAMAAELSVAPTGLPPGAEGADPTVALDDRTVVRAVTARGGPSGARRAVGAVGFAQGAVVGFRGALAEPRGRRLLAAVAAAVLAIIVLAALLGGGGGSTRSSTAAQLERVAGGLGADDGNAAAGDALALRKVASEVRAGGGRDDAAALLDQVQRQQSAGQLTPAAGARIAAALYRVPGVTTVTTLASTTTTTAAPATTTSPPRTTAPPARGKGDKGAKGD